MCVIVCATAARRISGSSPLDDVVCTVGLNTGPSEIGLVQARVGEGSLKPGGQTDGSVMRERVVATFAASPIVPSRRNRWRCLQTSNQTGLQSDIIIEWHILQV